MNDHGQILDPGTVRIERVLPGPIERVWRYITESELRARWLAAGEFELRPGGRAELRFDHASLSPEKAYPERYRSAEVRAASRRCSPARRRGCSRSPGAAPASPPRCPSSSRLSTTRCASS
ncbi:SRPBCC domain-containing protein [Nannocystis pusilla]|uniref:SRPBCC domain-containing protein n=1 Tax=Nannocystis pusilla TaxID=889268 RepID=UPI003B82472E